MAISDGRIRAMPSALKLREDYSAEVITSIGMRDGAHVGQSL
jgi:hypothetical protein